MKPLVINTGRINIPLVDHLGNDIGVISINPNDFNIISRSREGFKQLSDMEKEMTMIFDQENVDISDDLVTTKLSEIDNKVRDIVDFVFDYEVSETVFKNISCITLINVGKEIKPFVLVLMDALMPTIKEIVEKNQTIDNAKVEKYKKKYIK